MKNSIYELKYLGKTYYKVTYKVESIESKVIKFSECFLDENLDKVPDFLQEELMDGEWDTDVSLVKKELMREALNSHKDYIEILTEQNEIMATALKDLIDYHHLIGNRDCSFTTNEIHINLYKLAENGLKDADSVSLDKDVERLLPLSIFGFTSAEELLADIKIITDNYKKQAI